MARGRGRAPRTARRCSTARVACSALACAGPHQRAFRGEPKSPCPPLPPAPGPRPPVACCVAPSPAPSARARALFSGRTPFFVLALPHFFSCRHFLAFFDAARADRYARMDASSHHQICHQGLNRPARSCLGPHPNFPIFLGDQRERRWRGRRQAHRPFVPKILRARQLAGAGQLRTAQDGGAAGRQRLAAAGGQAPALAASLCTWPAARVGWVGSGLGEGERAVDRSTLPGAPHDAARAGAEESRPQLSQPTRACRCASAPRVPPPIPAPTPPTRTHPLPPPSVSFARSGCRCLHSHTLMRTLAPTGPAAQCRMYASASTGLGRGRRWRTPARHARPDGRVAASATSAAASPSATGTGAAATGGELPELRAARGSNPAGVSAPDLLHFERRGWLCVRNVLDATEAEALFPAVMTSAREFKDAVEAEVRAGGSYLQVHNFHERCEATRQIATSARLGALAAALLGVGRVRLYGSSLFLKSVGMDATGWHSDLHTCPLDTNQFVTLWLPMRSLTLEDSALVYAAGSHRDFALPYWYTQEAMESDLDGRGYDVEEASPPLRAGDCTAHTGWTLHCAPPQAEDAARGRAALSLSYVVDGAPVLPIGAAGPKRAAGTDAGEDAGVAGGVLRRAFDSEAEREGWARWAARVPQGGCVDEDVGDLLPLVWPQKRSKKKKAAAASTGANAATKGGDGAASGAAVTAVENKHAQRASRAERKGRSSNEKLKGREGGRPPR